METGNKKQNYFDQFNYFRHLPHNSCPWEVQCSNKYYAENQKIHLFGSGYNATDQVGIESTIGGSSYQFMQNTLLGKKFHVGLIYLQVVSQGNAPADWLKNLVFSYKSADPNGNVTTKPIKVSDHYSDDQHQKDICEIYKEITLSAGSEISFTLPPGATLKMSFYPSLIGALRDVKHPFASHLLAKYTAIYDILHSKKIVPGDIVEALRTKNTRGMAILKIRTHGFCNEFLSYYIHNLIHNLGQVPADVYPIMVELCMELDRVLARLERIISNNLPTEEELKADLIFYNENLRKPGEKIRHWYVLQKEIAKAKKKADEEADERLKNSGAVMLTPIAPENPAAANKKTKQYKYIARKDYYHVDPMGIKKDQLLFKRKKRVFGHPFVDGSINGKWISIRMDGALNGVLVPAEVLQKIS